MLGLTFLDVQWLRSLQISVSEEDLESQWLAVLTDQSGSVRTAEFFHRGDAIDFVRGNIQKGDDFQLFPRLEPGANGFGFVRKGLSQRDREFLSSLGIVVEEFSQV
jgi:hypothetical protein